MNRELAPSEASFRLGGLRLYRPGAEKGAGFPFCNRFYHHRPGYKWVRPASVREPIAMRRHAPVQVRTVFSLSADGERVSPASAITLYSAGIRNNTITEISSRPGMNAPRKNTKQTLIFRLSFESRKRVRYVVPGCFGADVDVPGRLDAGVRIQ